MFPEINTQRLLLKQIVHDDQQFIFKGLSHPDVIPFYGVQYDSFESTKTQMDWYNKMLQVETGISWKIVDKRSSESMGVISIYYYKSEHNKAEVGFWILPQYWEKGFASEALKAAIDFWKNEKKLHRLEGFVEKGNTASSKLLEKAGFQYEGTMRDCEIKNGKYISLHVYALILD